LRRHGRVRPLVSEAFEKEEALTKAGAVPPGFEFSRVNACALDFEERVAERASRAWVFKGTRLPVSILFEHLEAGAM
jgi:hypothetical protein